MPTGPTLTPEGQPALRIEYQPPAEVADFLADPTFVTGFFGPFGCGKTTAGVLKAFGYAQAYPGARIAIIRSTWPELRDTTQKTFFEWLPEGVAGRYERTPKTFWLETSGPPAEIIFRALDDSDDISNVLSLEVGAAWMDEPQGGVGMRRDGTMALEPGIAHDLFLALLGRVGRQRGYPGMLWMTGNPPSPSHWITREFRYDPGASGADAPTNPREDYRLYLGTQATNRANLPPGYYERLEALYGRDTPMARRFIRGHWIEFATEQPFRAEWFLRYGPEGTEEAPPSRSDLVIEAGFDPAISKKDTAASSAMVIAGQCRRGINRGRLYVLHAEKGHWSVLEQVERILWAFREQKVREIRIEDVAYQRALGEVLEAEARRRNVRVNVDLVKPDADKLRRALAWSPLVENGTLVFGPGQEALTHAMLSVPMDPREWDLVDAAGLCIRGFPLLQGESEPIDAQTRPAPTARARSYAATPAKPPPVKAHHRPWLPTPTPDPMLTRAKGYAARVVPQRRQGPLR